MRFRHATLAVITLVLIFAASAQGASPNVLYSTAGSYGYDNCSMQIDCTPTANFGGGATCSKNCIAGAPVNGSFAFSLSVSGSPLHPPGPCLTRKVQGSVNIVWSDSTTTTASITGAYSKKKAGYNLKVTVTGGTNAFVALGAGSKGFAGHPPSPCSPGAFAGSLSLVH